MGLVDKGIKLLLSIIERCFAKKELKRSAFYDICNKSVIMNNRRDSTNFFCHLTSEHNFLRCFHSTCLTCSSLEFHISSFAAFQISFLKCYFSFCNKAEKFCFSLESLFSPCYLSKEIPCR